MDRYYPSGLDLGQIDTPAFVVDQAVLERNARIMYQVGVESGANMLLALKGYALFASFDLLRPTLMVFVPVRSMKQDWGEKKWGWKCTATALPTAVKVWPD